jgi:hypothetical protein
LPTRAPSQSIVPPLTVPPQKAEADIRNEIRNEVVAPSFRRCLPEGLGSTNPRNSNEKAPLAAGLFSFLHHKFAGAPGLDSGTGEFNKEAAL